MPPGTTMRTFLNSVRTGETRTSQALERLWKDRGGVLANKLGRSNALNGLPNWLRDELVRQGNRHPRLALGPAEFEHIREWPDTEKRKIRDALLTSLGPPRRGVRFRWKLHTGDASINPVDNPYGPGDMTVTFMSPQKNVRVASAPKKGPTDITVDV